jgi:hypothetical protein
MTDSDSASRQLRVIRSLMERATIYRSISAPTALVGGLLSLGGFVTAYYAKHHRHHPLSSNEFLIVWLAILALTCVANVIFLSRGSARVFFFLRHEIRADECCARLFLRRHADPDDP